MNSFVILYLFQDHAGQNWVGLHRTGVARYRNGHFRVFTARKVFRIGEFEYLRGPHNHLWLGSGHGGLGRIEAPLRDASHRRTRPDGLASDEVQAITEDNFGRIYAGTGLGVDRIDPDTGRIVHYTRADGLAEGEVEDALRDPAGDLWFGTYHGLSRLHPVAESDDKAFNVTIASVKVNGRAETTRLGAQQVACRFAARE